VTIRYKRSTSPSSWASRTSKLSAGQTAELKHSAADRFVPTRATCRRTAGCWTATLAGNRRRRQLFLKLQGWHRQDSLSVAYAYRLAELGHRVLLIDLDSQGHATQHLGSLPRASAARSSRSCQGVPIEDVIVPHALAEFDVLRPTCGMTDHRHLAHAMAGRDTTPAGPRRGVDRYEFIVMDAPPSFGLLNLTR